MVLKSQSVLSLPESNVNVKITTDANRIPLWFHFPQMSGKEPRFFSSADPIVCTEWGRRGLQAVEMGWDNIPGIYYRGLGTDCSMAHCDPIVMCTEWRGC